jgi:ribonuclease J
MDHDTNPLAGDTAGAARPSGESSAPRAFNSERGTPGRAQKPGFSRRGNGGGGNGGFQGRKGGSFQKKPMRGSMRPSHGRSSTPSADGSFQKKADDKIPPAGDNIRIIPLGGVEEIGRNMTMVEYKDDIIVIDAGFQFQEEDTPGIDYILPNTKYLEDRKDKIRGVIITHGHLDHIGGIPYIMPRIGNPPIYTRNLTGIMIKKRQEEFPHVAPLDIRSIEKDERLMLGKLPVKFFGVTHTIPDSMGIIIETPYGAIVTPGDYKLNHKDGVPVDEEEKQYKVFDTMKTLLLFADSTNIENPGFSTPESVVHKNLEDIIKNIKGRLIIGTFASQMATARRSSSKAAR